MKFGKITSAMALTMAVATVPAFALNTRTGRTTNGQYPSQAQDVFTRLDTNRDGVISRSEWPADPATFDRADVNRDGVITRSEAQQAFQNRQRNGQYGQYEKGQRFRGMDRNGDGVITRDEWRGNDQSFGQHDRNRDGVLSGDELRGNGKRLDKQNHGKGKTKAKRGHDRERDDD